jgi:hypothetical protein
MTDTATPSYEDLLRKAIEDAKAKAPTATDDLFRFASQAGRAVAAVTDGQAVLELLPATPGDPDTIAYQLVLRKAGSDAPPTDLGVYQLAPNGYPVLRWYSRRAWESKPDKANKPYPTADELESNFKWMVSHPESRLVAMVAYIQQTGQQAARG